MNIIETELTPPGAVLHRYSFFSNTLDATVR